MVLRSQSLVARAQVPMSCKGSFRAEEVVLELQVERTLLRFDVRGGIIFSGLVHWVRITKRAEMPVANKVQARTHGPFKLDLNLPRTYS